LRRPSAPSSNLWQHTGGEPIGAAALEGDAVADVIIIGGGFTGCSAALHLAQSGASVVLLEAGAVGDGGSGRNVGLVNAGLWLEPEKVEAILGPSNGGRLNDILAGGPDLVFSLIESHGIACEAVRAGTLHCAHSRAGLANLRERLRQYQARRWPVRLLTAEETRAKTGTPVFHGALLDTRAGTIQPLAYARGLARAAIEAGARLHERSAVRTVAYEAGLWRALTTTATVTARALLLATNAYHRPLTGLAAPCYTAIDYFQVATAPFTDAQPAKILPEGQGCWDTATVMSSFRRDRAGRLILGGMGSLGRSGRAANLAWARRKLALLFPEAASSTFEHGWHGRISMTADHIPKVLRLGPGAVSIYGYSGRGIAPGTVFGRAIAAFLASGDESVLPLSLLSGYSEGFTRLKALYYAAGATAFHLVDAR
jgi:glycine/D-amino acid oxidase-like deaminating enzyme